MRQVSPKPLLTNALPRRVLIKVSLQIINFYKQRKFRSARKDGFKFTGGWMKPPPAHHIPSPLCPAPARCQGLALPRKALPTTLKAWLHISSLLFPDSPVLAELPRHSTPASARVLHLEPRENSLNFPQQFRATLSFLQAVPKEPHYI